MDIPKTLQILDNEIDKLVDKYGMTSRLESVNEEWTDLMYNYYTDYRGPEDDNDIKRAILEIYHDIHSIKRFNKIPLADRMKHLSLNNRIAATGANAIRYKNFIVLTGERQKLEDIQKRFYDVYGIKGEFRDYRNDDGPVGLVYAQHNGRNLLEFGAVDSDMSDRTKRKRDDADDEHHHSSHNKQKKSNSYDFYIEDGYICLIGDPIKISDRLGDLLIPHHIDGKVVKVSLEFNTILVENDILGNAITKPSTPPPVYGRFKIYKTNGKTVVLGKRKYVEKLREILGVEKRTGRGNPNSADIVIINDQILAFLKSKLNITDTDDPLPEKFLPLFYHLYPSAIPRHEDTVFSLDDVMDDSGSWITFDEHNDITDFHEFRGNVRYLNPWIFTMKSRTNNMSRFEFLYTGAKTGAIYHIAVKRQSKWTKFLKTRLDTMNDKILVTPEFSNRFMSAMTVGVEYMYTFLVHEFSRESRHANALIFDLKNQRIVRFEPHGSFSGCYDQKVCDQYIRDAIGKHPLLKNYTYIGPSDYEHYAGPQVVEERHQTKYEPVTKQFGSKTRLIQAKGFCMAWSILFNHLSFLNFRRSPEAIYIRFFTGTPNELADNIRVFQSYLVKLLKRYSFN